MTTTDAVTPTDADERAIRAVVARADAAQSDPVALPALHAPQGVLVNFAGRRVLGRDAIAAAMAAALATPMRDVLTSVEVLDIRLATPDVAVVSCVKTVHDQREDADGPAFPATGALTYVLARAGETWQIALAQTTPIATT
jgi:uncharacterized protein (TIGR02246 family)